MLESINFADVNIIVDCGNEILPIGNYSATLTILKDYRTQRAVNK